MEQIRHTHQLKTGRLHAVSAELLFAADRALSS